MKRADGFPSGIIHSFLTVLVLVAALSSCKGGEITNLAQTPQKIAPEEKAVQAVKKEHFVFENMVLLAKKVDSPVLRKSGLYKVWVEKGVSPTPSFFVAIGEDNIPHVFDHAEAFLYRDRFSKVIEKENLILDETNISPYVNVMLLLLGGSAIQVNDVDEIIRKVPSFLSEDIKRFQDSIKPLRSQVEGQRRLIEFNTWNYDRIEKWRVETRANGDILVCDISVVAKFKMPGIA